MFRAKKFSWDGEEVKVTYSFNGGPEVPMQSAGAIRRAWAVGGKRVQA